MKYPKESSSIKDTRLLGYWHNGKVPVFDVASIHGFNQIVGYVKHINAGEGTVLYRGQAELYPTLIPSILHGNPSQEKVKEREADLSGYIERIIQDKPMQSLLHFDENTKRRYFYKQYVVESMLQHYGVQTRFQDFVDNHWTALWFALFKCESELMQGATKENSFKNYYYERRKPELTMNKEVPKCLELKIPQLRITPEPVLHEIIPVDKCTYEMIEDRKNLESILNIENDQRRQEAFYNLMEYQNEGKRRENQKLKTKYENDKKKNEERYQEEIKRYERNKESNIAYAYILLYVADTCGESFNGVYTGTETVTIDLRKALPSTLLRPCAQHGWTVRRFGEDNDLSDGVVCVLRLSVALVDEMMGEGSLVSQNNFFPPAENDTGYRDLLGREAIAPFEVDPPRHKHKEPSLFPFGTLQHFIEKK